MTPQSFTDSRSAAIEPAIAITGVTKIFPVPFQRQCLVAVRELNLTILPGEIYGLLGPNGSGKSTTLKMILGLVSPTQGKVTIFGRDSSLVESKEGVGFLPENPYFYRYLTGRETLRFYGKLGGLRGERLEKRTNELLSMLDLTSAGDRRLSGHSKGMLQRLGLAQALLHQPRLLILDEPTAGVDPAGARGIRDLILHLKKCGITVLLSSHLLEQMQEICDRVAILSKGALVREGVLKDLLLIENRTDIVLENASLELLSQMERMAQTSGARLVKRSRSRISLEEYFLNATQPPNPSQTEWK
jgi:ABC-2 type transport system ATP-binding protein